MLVYLCFGTELGYTANAAWYTHFTYMWQHGSWLHLILNSVSMFVLFNLVQRFYRPVVIVAVLVACAWSMSYVVSYDKPVVGASGMVYALMGMYFSLVILGKLKYAKIENMVLSLLSVAVFLAISMIKHNSAGLLHLACLAAGIFCGIGWEWVVCKFKK